MPPTPPSLRTSHARLFTGMYSIVFTFPRQTCANELPVVGGTAPSTEVISLMSFMIQRAGDRLVSNAPALVTNATSNLAECFMGIHCKLG